MVALAFSAKSFRVAAPTILTPGIRVTLSHPSICLDASHTSISIPIWRVFCSISATLGNDPSFIFSAAPGWSILRACPK